MVFCGLVIACRLAGSPTLRSPFLRNATTDGVVRRPSSFGITTGSLPSITATQLLVVPRSIPIIFPMFLILCSIVIVKVYAKGVQCANMAEEANRYSKNYKKLIIFIDNFQLHRAPKSLAFYEF